MKVINKFFDILDTWFAIFCFAAIGALCVYVLADANAAQLAKVAAAGVR